MPISWQKLLAIVGYAPKCLKWFCTRNSPALSVTSLTFGTWLVHTKAQASSCYGFCTRHNEFLLTGFPPQQTLVYMTLCSTCAIGKMKYIIISNPRAYKELQNDTKNMYMCVGMTKHKKVMVAQRKFSAQKGVLRKRLSKFGRSPLLTLLSNILHVQFPNTPI